MIANLFRTLVAIAAGLLTAGGYAPFDAWPLPLLGLAILYALVRTNSWRGSAWLGFAYGCGLFGFGVGWVHVSIATFGGLPIYVSLSLMAVLVAYLALFPAVTALLTAMARRHKPLVFGGVWLLSELLRGWLMTGFPWLEIGASQLDAPWSGFLAWGGASGASLLIALSAAAIIQSWYNHSYALLPVVCACLAIVSGRYTMIHDRAATVPVALVQGNVPQLLRWDPQARDKILDTYRRLLDQTHGAQLIVWPEAAVPVAESSALPYLAEIDYLARSQGAALVTGIVDYKANTQQFFNNLIVLGGGDTPPYYYGNPNRYSKHHLLPIGEFVPLGDLLRPLAPFFNLPMSDFTRGGYVQTNLVANGLHILPALCYEIAFSEQMRANLSADTDLLLTVSNDAWFGDSHGPLQHNDLARLRAIELGRPIVRATNTGVTSSYDAHGRPLGVLPQFSEGVLRIDLPRVTGRTPFSYVGQWPALGLALLLALTGLRRVKGRGANG